MIHYPTHYLTQKHSDLGDMTHNNHALLQLVWLRIKSAKENTDNFLQFNANDHIIDWNGTSSQCLTKSGILYSVPCCRGNHQALVYPGSPQQNYSMKTCQQQHIKELLVLLSSL
jgi:hypothetical protein